MVNMVKTLIKVKAGLSAVISENKNSSKMARETYYNWCTL